MASTPTAPLPNNDDVKYRGVRKRKWGKYVSEIRLPNSRDRIWLGSYHTAEKAARAFDAALFCLRGSGANFNFADDPPHIAGGQSLSPEEIQVVAQHYGNSYGDRDTNTDTNIDQQEATAAADGGEPEWRIPVVESEAVDLIDRSFWDMVDMNGGNAGSVSEFGLYPEPDEMYMQMQSHVDEVRVYEDEDDIYYDHGNLNYSLWNY